MILPYTLHKKDGRCKYHMIFDTETAPLYPENPMAVQLPYDIGITICAKNGKIVHGEQFVVEEIYRDNALMKNAYYFDKLPQYVKALAQGQAKELPFIEIRNRIIELIISYDVQVIGAYNMPFDVRAISWLIKNLYPQISWIYKKDDNGKILYNKKYDTPIKDHVAMFNKHFIYNDEVEHLCIWSLACETIMSSQEYADFCLENDFLSENKNFITNAETCYKFLTNNHDFEERHTGQSDSIIESRIMARAFEYSQYKVKSGVVHAPWRLAQVNNPHEIARREERERKERERKRKQEEKRLAKEKAKQTKVVI